jgi:DNA-binding XRE family transcriptional regulator
MLNTDDFIKRLRHLTDYYGLNAAVFADKIGVQRSSISHLLSGRNKPSLDFVMKIIEVFPDVNLYWFLNGKGDFLKTTSQILHIENEAISSTPIFNNVKIEEPVLNLFESIPKVENDPNIQATNFENKKLDSIFKVIIFYNDGTFSDFKYGALK